MQMFQNRKIKKTNRSQFDPQRENWRLSVLKRDKWKCLKCGSKNKRLLQAHHILKWSTHIHLRYEISNGISLCKKCHDMMKGNEQSFQKLCYMLIAGANVNARIGQKLIELENEEKEND